jgi:uncharacterized protein (TIGR02145 family)
MKNVLFIIASALCAISIISCYQRAILDDGIIVSKLCNGKGYDHKIYTCIKGELIGKCRGKDYYLDYQICDGNGYIKEKNSSSSSSDISSSSSSIMYDTLTDARDKKTYKTVVIGKQTWMAENLNYNAPNSKCHNNDPANCAKYGRLYDWVKALALPDSCYSSACGASQAKHKGVCPEGWHIPSKAEWGELHDFIAVEQPEIIKALVDLYGDTIKIAMADTQYTDYLTLKGNLVVKAIKLKSTSGWDNRYNGSSGNGTNDYGFSALPSIWHKKLDGSLQEGYANWWTASDDSVRCDFYSPRATCTHIYSIASYWNDIFQYMAVNNGQDGKESDASVRCVKD